MSDPTSGRKLTTPDEGGWKEEKAYPVVLLVDDDGAARQSDMEPGAPPLEPGTNV